MRPSSKGKPVTCPACKAELRYQPDQATIVCGFCARSFRIHRPNKDDKLKAASSSKEASIPALNVRVRESGSCENMPESKSKDAKMSQEARPRSDSRGRIARSTRSIETVEASSSNDACSSSSSSSGRGRRGSVDKDRNSVSNIQSDEGIRKLVRLMAQGSNFIQYKSDGTNVFRTSVSLYYDVQSEGSGLGCLFWCPAGIRIFDSTNSLLLDSIKEMTIGKQSPALQSKAASKAEQHHCFSIIGDHMSLDLEAESRGKLAVWLSGIHRLLTTARRVQFQSISEAEPESDLAREHTFIRWEIDRSGVVRSAEVVIAYRPGARLGALHWQSSSNSGSMPLHTITELCIGKNDQTFQRPECGSIDPLRCFTLYARDSVSLSLEAPDSRTRTTWLNGIHRILTEAGQMKPTRVAKPVAKPAAPAPPPVVAVVSEPHMTVPMVSLPSELRLGDINPSDIFKLLAFIGKGTYGRVYKAKDNRDGSIVALKVLECDSETLGDIQKEVHILQECKSPHVVALKGVFRLKNTVYIAMEYCAVGSLSDMMLVCRCTLSEKQIAAVMKMTLQGLSFLHSRKIIHRDVKAANILVNEEGQCKLADFGVSTVASTLSRKLTLIGSPFWMAPEVIKGAQYDEKADIWSLGITAIELACGHPPLSDMHPMTAMYQIPTIASPTLPDPSSWTSHFHNFVQMCVQKDHSQRPSAAKLIQHSFFAVTDMQDGVMAFVNQCLVEMKCHRDLEAAANPQEQGRMVAGGPLAGSTLTYR